MNTISADELKEKIVLHQIWLHDDGGERLVLIGYDLRGSNLSYSDLSDSNLSGSDLSGSDLRGSDLSGSDLSHSDLRGSDLSGSDIDFSSFPLWCGGSKFKCSEKLVQQLFAHICTLDVVDASDEMKTALTAIKSEAVKSHRAMDLGIIKE